MAQTGAVGSGVARVLTHHSMRVLDLAFHGGHPIRPQEKSSQRRGELDWISDAATA